MMSLWSAIFILILLIIISAIVSSAEISLAGARRIKLQNMVNEGNTKAALVLKLQEQPGRFITVVQIGLNTRMRLGQKVPLRGWRLSSSRLLLFYSQI